MFFKKNSFDQGWNANKAGQTLTDAAANFNAEAGSSEFHRFVEGFNAGQRDTDFVAPTVEEAVEAINA